MKPSPGLPTASRQLMGAPRRGVQPRQGAAPPPTCAASASTSTWRRCSTSPGPAATIAATERGFGSTAPRVAATAVPFARRCRRAASRPPPSTSPASARRRENTDFAVQRIGLSKRELRAVDEAPYRRFIAAGGDMVMLSTAIYPAFSPKPAAFARPIATGELRDRLGFDGRLDHRCARHASRCGLRRARQGRPRGGPRRHRPLLFTDYRRRRGAGRALLRAPALRRARPRHSKTRPAACCACAAGSRASAARRRDLHSPASLASASRHCTGRGPISFAAYIAASASARGPFRS